MMCVEDEELAAMGMCDEDEELMAMRTCPHGIRRTRGTSLVESVLRDKKSTRLAAQLMAGVHEQARIAVMKVVFLRTQAIRVRVDNVNLCNNL